MKKVILDNGLKLFIISDKNKHSTYISLNVLFGGIDDKYYIDNKIHKVNGGMAHLIEHLVLESNCYGDLMYNFGKIGIISNGATDINKTEFYIDAVTNVMDAIKILIKGIHNPVFDNDVIENIKKPILEEKNRSLDNYLSLIYNKSITNVFDSNFDSILGSIKDIKSINKKDIQEAFNAFYRPCNEIMVIMGNIDENEVFNLVKDTYNSLKFNQINFNKYDYSKNITIKNKYELVETILSVNQSIMIFLLNTDNYSVNEKITLDLCLYYFLKMNFGNMSILNKDLLDNKIIDSPISFESSIIKGKFYIRISSRTDKHDDFVNRVVDIFNNNYVFDEEIFELSKRSAIINLISRKDSINTTVEPLLANIIEYNYEEEDTIKDIQELSFEHYKDVIKSIDFSNYFTYQVKNKKN